MVWENENIIEVLKKSGVVVMPTDTLYGIVGRAEDVSVVNRIYDLRKRNPSKPCIILVGDIKEIEKFSVSLSEKQQEAIKNYWFLGSSRPTSIVLDCLDDKFLYLHRGTKTLAFRLPADKNLQNLLKQTGPLIAPSANLEGLPPAKNIDEAKKYFGDGVDLYLDAGEISSQASRVVKISKGGEIEVLRN
jgi:L-threonylcarbamoyladenylate synthase